jgi:hypothetical protein
VSEWQRAVATGGRRDDAEPAVVKAYEAGGASVKKISGKDVPDLLVGFLSETHLVEVKTNRAKLRDGQAEFARTWLGSPVVVARTPAQARKWLAVWRERPDDETERRATCAREGHTYTKAGVEGLMEFACCKRCGAMPYSRGGL